MSRTVPRLLVLAALALLGRDLFAAEALDRKPLPRPAVVPVALGDHTLLTWRDGPPYLSIPKLEDEPWVRYSSERRVLRLETGWYALDFDTEQIAITGFESQTSPRDEAAAAESALRARPLPASQWHLVIRVGDVVYRCVGRRALAVDNRGQPRVPLEFPVRVIESGRYFQKFALYDLEFRNEAGRKLPAEASLEIAAWPDRLALTLVVVPAKHLRAAQANVRLQSTGGMDASVAESPATWVAMQPHRTTLTMDATGAAIAPTPPVGVTIAVAPLERANRGVARWNPEEQCYRVGLEGPVWPTNDGSYPETMLDAWERYALTLENSSDTPQVIGLNFDPVVTPGLSGCVPLLLDEQGIPTGIPVQVSKNWHRPRGEPLPHMGPWLHGRTRLRLEPHTVRRLQFALVFARWGGVPSSSVAQLSLVGWGHNGFWDEFALGSFGESFCFQPLRVQRRSLLTDFRPLYQLGMAKGTPWTWTSNVGGGDTMVRYGRDGHYVPFKRHVTRYVSHGPNLAQLDYTELAADEAVESHVSVFLPRTDDQVRVYLRVRYEARRAADFSRLVLFQAGSDYYNDIESPRIAWGHAGGLVAEHAPNATTREPTRWLAAGEQPWISLHGQPRDDLARAGQATRGIIVREWRATLGGRVIAAPTFSAVRGFPPKHPLRAEIVPPGEITALQAGDRVEMLLEFLALPLSAERYYGPDEALRAALRAGANTWRPVQREAAENRPSLLRGNGERVAAFPLTVPAEAGETTTFSLEGGLGWIPVRLTGLRRADAMELWCESRAGLEPVRQGPVGRPFWQTDYDQPTATWSITYNLPAPKGGRPSYTARVKAQTEALVVP